MANKTVYKSGITAAGNIALMMDYLLCTVCNSMSIMLNYFLPTCKYKMKSTQYGLFVTCI